MSGLLDRLAARAIGIEGPTVRAVAAVRGRTPLVSGGAAEPDDLGFDVVRERVAGTDATPDRTQHPVSRAQRATTVDAVARARRPVRSPESPPAIDRDARGTTDGVTQSEPPVQARPMGAPERASQALRSPLLDTYAAVSHRIARLAPLQVPPTPQRGNAGAGPAELHIHIGRIDVIGAPPSHERKRPAVESTRRARSLEDYLARRKQE